MGARAEELARKFEAKAKEATAILNRLTDADWKKVTAAEKWTVGVTAHHVAGSHENLAKMIQAVAAGRAMPTFTMEMLDELNAQHAKEHAGCTKTETIALHERGAAVAAAAVRSLSDEQLGKSATVLAGKPPLTAEQIINGILISHIDQHFGSIRQAIGG